MILAQFRRGYGETEMMEDSLALLRFKHHDLVISVESHENVNPDIFMPFKLHALDSKVK